MTRRQWKKYPRKKKSSREAGGSSTNSKVQKPDGEVAIRSVKEIIFPFLTLVKYDAKDKDVEMVTDNFSTSEGDFHILCNIVSVLPVEYNVVTEVTYMEEEYSSEDMTRHKPICYYVMSDGCVDEKIPCLRGLI